MKIINKRISEFYSGNIYIAIGLLLIFSIVFLLLEIYNNRFWQSDFSVYYRAAQRVLEGNNLYQFVEDGHYVFKYSPVSAIFFIPITIFSLGAAKIIYWFFLTGVIIGGFYFCVDLASGGDVFNNTRRLNNIILLGALILVVHFQRELHLGQVNQILLVLYLLAAYLFEKDKALLFSVVLAVSIFFKPFGLIFIPYLIVKGKYKETLYYVLITIALFFLPLFFYSIDEFISQNALWINELVVELGNKQNILQSANHTVFSVIVRFTPLCLISFTPAIVKVYQLSVLVIIGLLVLLFINKGRKIESNTIADFALLISLIPLLSFTSQNAFGFAGLLVFLLLINFKGFSFTEKVTTIIGFVFLGGNYNDIWGSSLSAFFNDISLVSLGTLLLIIILFRKRYQGIL